MVQRIMIGLFLVSLASAQVSTAGAQTSIENRDVLSPAVRGNYSRRMESVKIPDTRDRQYDGHTTKIDDVQANMDPGGSQKDNQNADKSSD